MAASENISVQQENPNKNMGQRLWDLLTKPADSITDRANRRQARTLSAFLFVFFLLTAVRLLVGIRSGSYLKEPQPFITVVVLDVLILIAYGLSRTKQYSWGSGLAVVGTIVTVILSVVRRGDYEPARVYASLMWLIPALILGSAFFSWKASFFVSVFTLTSILILPFIIPGIEMEAVSSAFSILFVVSVLIVLVDRFRNQLEADRQKALTAANQELEHASTLLEQRVAERTKALQLATEISRVLSQITDLENLLHESVETIRARFDFYYVQIYLTDLSINSLTLKAGTGNVGQELARIGHRLLIGPGSINGAAAAEKQAVIVSDTATNPLFRPNAFLPRTRSEMAVPLIIGNQVVGVLDLQSAEPNALSAENLPAFEALAGQLAVAIENAKLLSEAAVARAEVESFTRRITRDGWSSYLDAVAHPRFLGFSYNADTLTPLNSPLSQDLAERNVAQVPIDIVGETVGAIQIEADAEHIWTADDLDLIQTVATQVGQQVEMLRALDQAAQYRQEAERALRRVTHEAWLTYEESPDLADGFVYDQVEITPATAVSPANDSPDTLYHDLSIHGEAVGELTVKKTGNMNETFANELVTAVADQLVSHMENLRLSEQTEKALAETQRRGRELTIINRVVGKVSQATGMQESMQIIVEELVDATNVDQVRIALVDNTYSKLTIIAERYDTTTNESALGLEIPLAGNTLTQSIIDTQNYIFVQDVQSSPLTENIRDMLSEQHIKSFVVMPIIIDNVVIGTVGLDLLDEQKTITNDQIRLAETLILQAATAIQKAQLFEETEARAEELAVINEVAQTVAQQTDRQELMKTIQAQIQRVMVVDAFFIAIYDAQQDLIEYPYIYDDGRIYQDPPAIPSRTSRVWEVLQTGQPILVNRSQEEIDEINNRQSANMLGDVQRASASLLYVPLLSGRETLGVLSIQSYHLNAYSGANITLLSGIANHVAVALENMRLLAETRQTAEREQVLRTISATINASIDAESVLQTAAREIGRVLGTETFVYLTPDIRATQAAAGTVPDKKQNGNGTIS